MILLLKLGRVKRAEFLPGCGEAKEPLPGYAVLKNVLIIRKGKLEVYRYPVVDYNIVSIIVL